VRHLPCRYGSSSATVAWLSRPAASAMAGAVPALGSTDWYDTGLSDDTRRAQV
jgi:hypothetical protein